MSIGVIIPTKCTKETWPYALRAISSALEFTPGATAIVVDDASEEWPEDMPDVLRSLAAERPIVVQRYREGGGLSRSWNAGLRLCRSLGLEYAVPANADVVFTPGWWKPVAEALEQKAFVGPMTNAPGHCKAQQIAKSLEGYTMDDREDVLAEQAEGLRRKFKESIRNTDRLNGFLWAGKTSTFWEMALGGGNVYNPKIPLAGNEDDLRKRAIKAGKTLGIALGSFIFHYRSVMRPSSPRLSHGQYRNEKLPTIDAIRKGLNEAPQPAERSELAAPVESKAKRTAQCVHLGKVVDRNSKGCHRCWTRECDLLKKHVQMRTECETCGSYEAV
ncbi:Glycosyl transferase family 2 [Planctomycetes bacterium Pan216]|uniref:Glycosyl transferase family 2 n=1 Tax=Kolteria novifilia TaxID=2527975 RepID=A0A518AZ72_9BACT|nr:Glycosyl transferase family 2 [Planctomycetes bacterium Pan216]